ncbi:hypothetical protein [Novosphingobium sp.]|uniref:hypothetical protein n=1 Tax=Novosphingobium sp. TaxID=1874826 RepID=UPI003B518F49
MTNTNRPDTATDTAPGQPRRHWALGVSLVLVLAIVIGVAWIWAPAREYARTGASYGARVACSCRYLGGRTLNDCHKDMEGATSWVRLSDDPANRSVSASFLFLARQTATYHEGWGCQLQPWSGGR